MAPIIVKPCAVLGCIPEDLKRFCFPRPPELAEKWRRVCGNPKLYTIPAVKLHRRYNICRKHFAQHQFTNHLMERLNRNSVPSLFLPSSDYSINLSRITPGVFVDPSDIVEVDVTFPPVDIEMINSISVDNDSRVAPDKTLSAADVVDSESALVPKGVENCTDSSDDGDGDAGNSDAGNSDAGNSDASPSSIPQNDQVVLRSERNEISALETEETIPPINDYYRYTLCRLCFSSNGPLTDIFEDEQEFKISDAIKDLLHFEVSKGDDFPQFICSICHVKLGEFLEFKNKLSKLKDAFEKVLQGLRGSHCEDKLGVVAGQDDSAISKDLENTKESDDIKNVSELEETADEDNWEQGNEAETEDFSDSEEAVSDLEETAVHELPEPEIRSGVGPDVEELILQSDYRCNDCGEVFKFRNLLSKHRREHRKMWPMSCQYCGKRFRTLMDLNSHIIRHSNYKPYECEHCGLRCRLKSSLVQHKMIHSGDKPFLCSMCGMSFRNRAHLTIHMRMHTDIKCYKCEECGAEFPCSRKLSLHFARHEKKRSYRCGDCGKSFWKAESLSQHVISVHQTEKRFQCSICLKRFSIRKYLSGHMKIHDRQICAE